MGLFMIGLTVGDRVRNARTQKGWSQKQLASAASVSQVTISNIENNNTESSKNIPDVAKALGTSVEYLISGHEYIMRQVGKLEDFVVVGKDGEDAIPKPEEYVLVPQFDVHGSCGGGAIIDTIEVKGGLVFSKRWLKEHALPTGEDLRVIYAKGESMYPTIEDGQVLLINPHDLQPKSNKVYFICIDEQYYVKRLINMVTHWVIRSDNADKNTWPDITLTSEQLKHIEIEGRVVWRGGTM